MAIGTILLAEDSHDDAQAVKHLFRKIGVLNPLRVVSSVDAAIAYLEGTGIYANRARYPFPMMLLLDVRMPPRDGIEVLQWLHQHARESVISIVLTGYDDLRRMQDAYQYGAKSFLIKPLTEGDFSSIIGSFKGIEIAKASPRSGTQERSDAA